MFKHPVRRMRLGALSPTLRTTLTRTISEDVWWGRKTLFIRQDSTRFNPLSMALLIPSATSGNRVVQHKLDTTEPLVYSILLPIRNSTSGRTTLIYQSRDWNIGYGFTPYRITIRITPP